MAKIKGDIFEHPVLEQKLKSRSAFLCAMQSSVTFFSSVMS
jgi:hypothetical protein